MRMNVGMLLKSLCGVVFTWGSACICILLVITSKVIAAGNTPPTSLIVEWQDSCEEKTASPYFKLDISLIGEVGFRGISGVKEIGDRHKKISRSSARSLIKTAEKTLKDSSTRGLQYSATTLAGSTAHGNCFFLEIRGMNSISKGFVLMERKDGMLLEKGLRHATDFEKWICPARVEVPHRDDYCETPSLSYSYADKESCGVTHVTNIYRSGIVHYYIRDLNGGDIYKKADASVIKKLRDVVDQLASQGLPMEEILMPTERKPMTKSSQSKKLNKDMRELSVFGEFAVSFRNKLRDAVDIEWNEIPSSGTCVREKEGESMGQLSIER